MASKKSGLGNLFRFLSPSLPLRPTSPVTRYQDLVGYESQSQLAREYNAQEVMAQLPEPSFTFIPAEQVRPPTDPQQMYHEQGPYYPPEPCYSQEPDPPQLPYLAQQTYRPHPTNPVYPPYVATATSHVCQLCVATDRFPIRPSRCPFTGEHIGLPHSQQHPPIVTTSSMHQAQRNRFECVEFVEVQADDGEEYMTEREQNWGDWTGDNSMEDHVEYISDRRKKLIEDWMDKCIAEECPGWEWVGELDIWGGEGGKMLGTLMRLTRILRGMLGGCWMKCGEYNLSCWETCIWD